MWRLALRNLYTRPMRSLLSWMGLTVAVAGMVALFSVAEGIQATVEKTFGKIPGVVVLQPGAPIPLFSRLPVAWGEEIAKLPGVHVVDLEIWARAHIIDDITVFAPPRFLFGTDIPSRLKLRDSIYGKHLVEGRFLQEGDVGTWNCLISRIISEEFGKGIGDTLTVDGQAMTIVGIYHTGSVLLDVSILVDQNQARKHARLDPRYACAFYVEPEVGVSREVLQKQIQKHFEGRKEESPALWTSGLTAVWPLMMNSPLQWLPAMFNNAWNSTTKVEPPSPQETKPNTEKKNARTPKSRRAPKKATSAVEVRGAEDWAEEFANFSADLELILMILTSIGLSIAVLSIVNTMLMSVSERIIELGILKANGWSNREVLLLITLESAWLGLGGGVAGTLIGGLATLVINNQWPDRLQLYASPQLLVFSLVFSTTLGVLGGLYPAIWASRMMPMDAIRRG